MRFKAAPQLGQSPWLILWVYTGCPPRSDHWRLELRVLLIDEVPRNVLSLGVEFEEDGVLIFITPFQFAELLAISSLFVIFLGLNYDSVWAKDASLMHYDVGINSHGPLAIRGLSATNNVFDRIYLFGISS